MKKIFMTMMAVCFTAMCMTGCLGDDSTSSNYHDVTSYDKTTIMTAMVGDYSGFVKFSSTSSYKDSLDADFTIKSDTTIAFKYPIAILANLVDSARTDIVKALTDAPEQTLSLSFLIPATVYKTIWENYWQEANYIPILYPNETEKTFTSGDYSFTLTYDTYYDIINAGYFNFEYYNNQVMGYIRPVTLTVTAANGSTTTAFSENTEPTIFYGKK